MINFQLFLEDFDGPVIVCTSNIAWFGPANKTENRDLLVNISKFRLSWNEQRTIHLLMVQSQISNIMNILTKEYLECLKDIQINKQHIQTRNCKLTFWRYYRSIQLSTQPNSVVTHINDFLRKRSFQLPKSSLIKVQLK